MSSGVPARARKHANFPYYGSDIELQTTYMLDNLKKTFELRAHRSIRCQGAGIHD